MQAAVTHSTRHLARPISVYVHWPYCKSICPYCDFNRFLDGPRSLPAERIAAAVLRDLSFFLDDIGHDGSRGGENAAIELRSIFFGGGSPSLAPESFVRAVIAGTRAAFEERGGSVASDMEVTLEANPTSAEAAKMHSWAADGVTRLSVGVQALNEADLAYLGRKHSVREAMDTIGIAKATFPRVSLDLMYGRHREQSVDSWTEELQRAIDLGTDHMSLYTLTIEQNTPFYRRHQPTATNRLFQPDEDAMADLYEATVATTAAAGLQQYEISNFAREGHQCRHNVNYWESGEWVGLGPGAASRINHWHDGAWRRRAVSLTRAPEKWEGATAATLLAEDSLLSPEEHLTEVLMMGLRTSRGVHRTTVDFAFPELSRDIERLLSKEAATRLQQEGLLHVCRSDGWQAVRATPAGLALLDSLVAQLVT